MLMMLISMLILLLVSSLYIAEEIYSSRFFLQREMSTLGRTLGDSCKKLLMVKELAATKQIIASLQVQKNIHVAYLFDETGTPVSEYLDPSDTPFVLKHIALDFADPKTKFWATLEQQKITSSWNHLGLFLPIKHNDRQVGSIYLMSDLRDLYGRLSGVVFVVLSLIGLLLFLSWWLSGKLQRPVSAPLLSLVETMGSISQSKDFSLRAQKEGGDEVGLLVDGFNRMLEQIETHRQELVAHQQSLENTVEVRTEELREMVGVLERAKQQAEAASESKSQFLANITHELRTPLIGVLGMNELLFRTSMDGQQQMLATTVQKSGEDLLLLINNVLDFSKIEAGKMQLAQAEFELARTVDEVLELLSGPAADKGVALYSDVSLPAACRVIGDELRMRQILMNLIGNAIKFTGEGSVTAKLDCQFTSADVAEFVLEIIDTGIGMTDEAQQQIFSVFYQADGTHTRKYGGTGLGLSIVQQLVQLLEGRISLESSVGHGSSFKVSFKLPFVSAADMPLAESQRQRPVLIYAVDDTVQQLLSTRLHDLGIVAVAATSVENAWYQLGSAERNGRPFRQVIFSAEALLPDGQTLYSAIRAEVKFSSLRRILLMKRIQTIDLGKQEHKLYLPVGWSDLHETLCQSWHELHLVEKLPNDLQPAVVSAPSVAKAKLLLAGGSVASRELIKISLSDLSVCVDSASDFDQLQNKVAGVVYAAIVFDLSTLPLPQVHDYCQQQRTKERLFVLCPPSGNVDFLRPLVAGVIEKPFKQEAFLQMLLPLLKSETILSLNSTVDDEACL